MASAKIIWYCVLYKYVTKFFVTLFKEVTNFAQTKNAKVCEDAKHYRMDLRYAEFTTEWNRSKFNRQENSSKIIITEYLPELCYYIPWDLYFSIIFYFFSKTTLAVASSNIQPVSRGA